MNVKIIRHTGCLRLISLDHHSQGNPVELALIVRDDFANGKWKIHDWRISPDKTLSAYLEDLDGRSSAIASEENLKKAKAQLKDFWIEDGNIYWWEYENSVIKEFSQSREYSRRRSCWSFTEARTYLSKTRKFWLNFKDEDLLKAKINNPHLQPFSLR